MARVAYEIRVVGALPSSFFEDFEGITVADEHGGLTLHAELADQSELHGVLDALRRDGAVLVEVRREEVLEPYDGDAAADDSADRPTKDA
jgi:hypothetical protein